MGAGGRPPFFENNEALESLVDDYFENPPRTRKVKIGKGEDAEVIEMPVLSITGLALHLGFVSRQSMYDYELKDEFTYTIKKARTFIEREYEEALMYGNTTGAIFALKNMGWKDRTDITSDDKPLESKPITVEIVKPTDED